MTSNFLRIRAALLAAILTAATLPLPAVAVASLATPASQPLQQGAEPFAGPPALADGLIIRFAAQKAPGSASTSQAQRTQQASALSAALSAATGAELEYAHDISADSQLFWLPDMVPASEAHSLAARLMARRDALGIESVEPDYRLFPTLTPNDADYADQWHYQALSTANYGMNMPAVWDIVTGSTSLVIAVVDTGILFNHPDLAGRTVPGYDFISRVATANDGNGRDADAGDPGDWITQAENASGTFKGCGAGDSSWHGSHVAGTIGAASNNGIGVAGVNWRSKILPIRVLGKCGGSLADIAAGMRWAAGLPVTGLPNNPNPARIINMSLGGPSACSATYQSAINDVTARGVVVVVAAGNENTNTSTSQPANCQNVITVGATQQNGNRASYSNFGSEVDVSAPGGSNNSAPGGILSTVDASATAPTTPSYTYYAGTSMATPNVAGVISLILSLQPSLTPAQILSILQSSVTAFPATSDCATKKCGTGILDALKAVNAAKGLQISHNFIPNVMLGEASPIVPPDPVGNLGNGNFEAGRTVWHEASAYENTPVIYSREDLAGASPALPHDGNYLAWLGGLDEETASISQTVLVPATATKLTFWAQVSSTDMCGFNYDTARVLLDDAQIYELDLCMGSSTTTWEQKTLNITPYAGKTLILQFEISTDEMERSNWYVDTIAFE